MAKYRLKADQTPPRSFKKELQMISYRGEALSSEDGNVLLAEADVYYPPDYLASSAVSVVVDPDSYKNESVSLGNKFSKRTPAALPIVEQFKEQSEVSRTLLGIDRAETQTGLFEDVSSYGLDAKDWVVYYSNEDWNQSGTWVYKNSASGPHNPHFNKDDAGYSAIELGSYAVPYLSPGNAVLDGILAGSGGYVGPEWGKYLQSVIAMYIIEYMVNNFTASNKAKFNIEYLENKYPKLNGAFNRLFWDKIWLDIDQGRFESSSNIPIMPQGVLVNMYVNPVSEADLLNIEQAYGTSSSILEPSKKTPSVNFNDVFFATTRYTWEEPNQGHFRIKTNQNADVWSEYWGVDFNDLPEDLKNWEFRVWETEPPASSPEVKYKLPYYRITSLIPAQSLIFGASWPKTYSDPSIPQVQGKIAEGNQIGSRESKSTTVVLTSTRAFRYQPGRISGFTYGTRISEEGAGPGTVLEFGVENFTDGYFFRLKNGTDFSIVRRSTISLGNTQLFRDAGYIEREGYVEQLSGVIKYKDELTDSEVLLYEEDVENKIKTKVYETSIQQNQMNGDGLNSQGASGYIYNPDTVTMYKIEFGWYGAIGARFYSYVPQGHEEARWVALHTLVIENNIGQPCLQDPFFFFKYRLYVDNPSKIRLPQFIQKYGASYYIDGGDEGTISVLSSKATNRKVKQVTLVDEQEIPIYKWGSALSIKPKQYITNTSGNEFPNKKEVFPIKASIISTKNVELKLVNQFGCQENGYVFQEGYRCELPESQRLRGIFNIRSLQADSATLEDLGRDPTSPTPTISWVDKDPNLAYSASASNLGTGPNSFIGWDAYEKSLYGAHIIGDKLYGAYINPEEEGTGSTSGWSGKEIAIARSTQQQYFPGLASTNRTWIHSELTTKYPLGTYPLKLSRYRRDTTLLSSIPITSNEFFLFFTTKGPTNGGGIACEDPNFGTKCDGPKHFGDLTLGLLWPKASSASTNAEEAYPLRIFSSNRAREYEGSFGLIDPDLDAGETAAITQADGEEVYIVENGSTGNYVVDKTVPDAASYRYYEGLPINVFDRELDGNTMKVNYVGRVFLNSNGLEVFEGLDNSVSEINNQIPQVPGADGGQCNAIYGKVGEVSEKCIVRTVGRDNIVKTISINGTVFTIYYLAKQTPWPETLYVKDGGIGASEELDIQKLSDLSQISVITIGQSQEELSPEGSNVREYYLPVITNNGGNISGFLNQESKAKYKAISLYAPSLIKKEGRLLERKVVGQNVFPLRWFISMREGAEIGAVSVGQVTPNGIVQSAFSPIGSTLSINHHTNNVPDSHIGPGSTPINAAKKSIKTFIEPGTLDTSEGADFSYVDTSEGTSASVYKTKRCPSFISRDTLAGTGISSVGDYPIRWLKFKDSGDAIGSFFIPANTPTEIDLKSLFNISAESIGPSFWGNKALFAIVRSLDDEGGDGKISISINYKEQ